MAKPKLWNPTQKQLSEYERLLKEYNKLRKKIKRAHKILTGDEVSPRAPSMVNLQRERKMTLRQIRLTPRKVFNLKMRHLRKIVQGGLKPFYKQYKEQYLELYRTWIIDETPNGYNNAYYSDDQIKGRAEEDPKMAQFMRDYNRLVVMSPYVFAYAMLTGRMPAFKLLYAEFKSEFTFSENWGDQMHKAIRQLWNFREKDAKAQLEGRHYVGAERKERIKNEHYWEAVEKKGIVRK